jgi:hypothetical protein
MGLDVSVLFRDPNFVHANCVDFSGQFHSGLKMMFWGILHPKHKLMLMIHPKALAERIVYPFAKRQEMDKKDQRNILGRRRRVAS